MEVANFSLEGKVALITGASRGIGEAIAHTFAKNGADVILVSRKQEALDEVAIAIKANGGKATAIAAHCARADEIDKLMERVKSDFGRLDVLVNNAGTNIHYGLSTEITEVMFDKIMALNVKGPFLLSQHAVKLMKANGGGSIINISSVAGLRSARNQTVYGMSKFAVVGMTKSMAVEFGRDNIRVNAIAPGLVETRLASTLIETPEVYERFKASHPMGRHGQPVEMAGAALYLASDASSFTNGEVIVCDGGAIA